jgi:hypothetical protein
MLYTLQGFRLFFARHPTPTTKNMNTLPTTLNEIRNSASSMFNDKAVASVNVETTYGLVTVFRNGDIKIA